MSKSRRRLNVKRHIVVQLGYGMQGKAALYDLLQSPIVDKIIVADYKPGFIEEISKINSDKVTAVVMDAFNYNSVVDLMKKADVAVDLLPGSFSFQTAKAAVEAGVDLVSAMHLVNPGEQDPKKVKKQRDALQVQSAEAQKKGITILQESGMGPGIDLVLGSKAVKELDEVHAFHSYGAGFPELTFANNPLRYTFTWSIIGVIRSSYRPAKVIKRGNVVEIAADEMFSPQNTHTLNPPDMGSPLECFPNVDSEQYAVAFNIKDKVQDMGRYIARWPGHGAFWYAMAKCGFLKEEPIICGDTYISLSVFCASLLGPQKQFFYDKNERDVALIHIDVRGTLGGHPKELYGR